MLNVEPCVTNTRSIYIMLKMAIDIIIYDDSTAYSLEGILIASYFNSYHTGTSVYHGALDGRGGGSQNPVSNFKKQPCRMSLSLAKWPCRMSIVTNSPVARH